MFVVFGWGVFIVCFVFWLCVWWMVVLLVGWCRLVLGLVGCGGGMLVV